MNTPNTPVLRCTYCSSTDVEIVGSDSTRDATELRCLNCGRQFLADVENVNVEVPGPASQTPPAAPAS